MKLEFLRSRYYHSWGIIRRRRAVVVLEQDTTGASIVSQVASLCGQVGVLGEEKEDLLGMTFAVGKRPSSFLWQANEKNLKARMQEASCSDCLARIVL